MKTAIVYYSKHHGNTKKLLDAITAAADVDLIDVTADKDTDLSGYDRIGFASGIYYSSFAKQIIRMRRKIFRMRNRSSSSIHMERQRAIS